MVQVSLQLSDLNPTETLLCTMVYVIYFKHLTCSGSAVSEQTTKSD